MNISSLKEVLPFFKNAKVTPFLWGPRGVGKTQGVAQYAKETGQNLVELRLGQMEAGDIIGLPEIHNGKTYHRPPNWWPEPDTEGVIFIDEPNRGTRDVLQAIFQLVNERRLYEHVLPEGWTVIMAANPNTEGYIVADVDDEAFMDRFCHIRVGCTHPEWISYAEDNGFSNHVVNYLKLTPSVLGNKEIDFPRFDEDITPSPRSWDAVSRLLNAGLPDKFVMEVCFGLIGTSATTAFIESMKDFDKPVACEDVLSSFSKVKSKIASYSDTSSKGKGRPDLIKVTCSDLTKLFKKHEKESHAYTDSQVKNIIDFIKTIPTEAAYSFLYDIMNVGDWMTELCKDKQIIDLIKKSKGD